MNPAQETPIWLHEGMQVYRTFHRIFDCHRHGWANLQSMHLNFPFADDTEFARLHAAIRLVLPLLPVLAASSPFQDGLRNGCLDRRLSAYRLNSARIPSIAGQIIPEPVFTRREYEEQILRRMYRDIAPLDPAGILQDEFLNARGAIARFCRNAIEIRLIDMQECPAADLAVAAATLAVIRALVEERWSNLEFQKSLSTDLLENVLRATIARGDRARVDDGQYLRAFGLTEEPYLPAGKLWQLLLAKVSFPESPEANQWRQNVHLILDQGCLARRILRAAGRAPSRQSLYEVYRRLCDCLETGKTFIP